MPIREEFLKDNGGKNYIEAGPGSTPREIIAQLRRTQGANDNWHIVLKGNDGKWRISIAHKILKRVIESPQLMDATLSELDLPPAHVVDQNDMGGPAALEQARSRPDKVIIVTANGALIGVVAEVVNDVVGQAATGFHVAWFTHAGTLKSTISLQSKMPQRPGPLPRVPAMPAVATPRAPDTGRPLPRSISVPSRPATCPARPLHPKHRPQMPSLPPPDSRWSTPSRPPGLRGRHPCRKAGRSALSRASPRSARPPCAAPAADPQRQN